MLILGSRTGFLVVLWISGVVRAFKVANLIVLVRIFVIVDKLWISWCVGDFLWCGKGYFWNCGVIFRYLMRLWGFLRILKGGIGDFAVGVWENQLIGI